MNSIIVSFIVIALNSEKTINNVFECLKKQSYPHDRIEVVLVDGLSVDNTKKMMLDFKRNNNDFNRIIVLENKGRTLPCGWNVALDEIKGDVVLRVDAHTSFPSDFIELNVRLIEKGEDICGGKVISLPSKNSRWNITLNEAENSMFGGGIATFRRADSARYVNTIAFAMYRKTVFNKVGKYNELLTRTEDNEMHYRMKNAGYMFYYDPQIISYRETRSSFGQLLKQKYLNGYWIGRTLEIEPRCFSLYHFVPLCFVISIIITSLLMFFNVYWAGFLLWCLYWIANFAMTISAFFSKNKNICFLLLPIIFLGLHLCYGVGTIVGVFEMIIRKIKKSINEDK